MSEDIAAIPEDMLIGSWRLTEWLAQGGMGEVYVAEHELMGREAVVKLLHPRLLNDEDVVRRFLNEARASAAIRHPGIVEIFDLGTDRDRVYIVMERLYGETLSDRIARAPLILGLVMTLTKQLVGALAAAHEHDIVHRDLKPENLFVVDDPDVPGGKRIKILDFGVAKLAPEQGGGGMTAQGMVFGTPAYMAPEQCQNSAMVDHRSDLYAVGCIMYEMLCSDPPFGHGGLELFAAHLRDRPAPPSARGVDVPADVEHIVLRLLAKNPDERFRDCEELLAALDNAKLTARRRAQGKQRSRRDNLAFAETVPPYAVQEVVQEELTAKVPRMTDGQSDGGASDGSISDDGASNEDSRNRETMPRLESQAGEKTPERADTGDGEASGKKARKATASPTTHRHATGQVIDLEEPEPETSPPNRKFGWLAAAFMVVVLIGSGVAYKMVADESEREAASAKPDPTPAPLPPPPPPPPPKPTGEEFVAEGLQAVQNLKFTDAAIAAQKALNTAEVGSEIHKAATELEQQARESLKYQWAYDAFNSAVEANNIASAVYAYQQLPEDSVFKDRAGAVYLAMQNDWLSPLSTRAEKLVRKKKCSKADDIANEVRRMFPEAVGSFDESVNKCYEKRNRRRKKKPPPPPELTPEQLAKLPKTVPTYTINQTLDKYKKHMRACLIENPLDVTSKKKTVPVVGTMQIEPNGMLSKLDISPRSSDLSTCLFLELRQERFPPARQVTIKKFPVGKGYVKNVKGKKPATDKGKPGSDSAEPKAKSEAQSEAQSDAQSDKEKDKTKAEDNSQSGDQST